MKCSKCGADLIQGAKICHRCGAQLVAEKPCAYCGNPMPANAVVCPSCGKLQPQVPEGNSAAPLFSAHKFEPRPQTSFRWWYILIGFALFVVGGLVGAGIGVNVKENSDPAISAPTVSAASEVEPQKPSTGLSKSVESVLGEADIDAILAAPDEYLKRTIEITRTVLDEPIEQTSSTILHTKAQEGNDSWQFNIMVKGNQPKISAGDTVKISGEILSSSVNAETSLNILMIAADSVEVAESSGQAHEQQAEPQAPAQEPYKITYQNYGFYRNEILDSVTCFAIVEIENTGSKNLELGNATIDFEDRNGALLGTASSFVSTYPDIIRPGEKGYFQYDGSVSGDIDETTDCVFVPHLDAKETDMDYTAHEVSDTTLTQADIFEYLSAIGRVTNQTSAEEYIDLDCILRREDGTPIAVLHSGESIGAGQTVTFEVTGVLLMNLNIQLDDVASYEILAHS